MSKHFDKPQGNPKGGDPRRGQGAAPPPTPPTGEPPPGGAAGTGDQRTRPANHVEGLARAKAFSPRIAEDPQADAVAVFSGVIHPAAA